MALSFFICARQYVLFSLCSELLHPQYLLWHNNMALSLSHNLRSCFSMLYQVSTYLNGLILVGINFALTLTLVLMFLADFLFFTIVAKPPTIVSRAVLAPALELSLAQNKLLALSSYDQNNFC